VSQLKAVVIGTFLHLAHEEELIRNSFIHADIRAPLVRRKGDMRNDVRCGFETVKARNIDRIRVDGIIEKLKDRVAGTRVYVSVDIDVLDPAFAPGKPSQTIQGHQFSWTLYLLAGIFHWDFVRDKDIISWR